MNAKKFSMAALLALMATQASAQWICKILHPLEKDRCEAIKTVGEVAAGAVQRMNERAKWKKWQKELYAEATVALASKLTPKNSHPERCMEAAEPLLHELLGQPASASQAAAQLALAVVQAGGAGAIVRSSSCITARALRNSAETPEEGDQKAS